MSDQIYSAGKAFSCSICTCFIDLVEVNMQCCLPYILHYRPLLLVSEFCRNNCAYVYECIGVFVFLFPIKLCSADSLCLLIVSSLWPINLYFCFTYFALGPNFRFGIRTGDSTQTLNQQSGWSVYQKPRSKYLF